MNPRSTRTLFAAFALGAFISGCSKDAAIAAESAAPPAAQAAGPTQDPCALISAAQVGKVFAGAKSGKRDNSLDKYGITTCAWDTPTNTLVAQIFAAKGSAEDEVRSRASGVIDPLKRGAGDKFRYEAVAGIGDAATLVAEAGDPPQGIFNDVAVIAVRKGDRMAVLFSRSLIDGDRAATIAALQGLGKTAAGRL
jgi:hypothetical protein